MKTKKYQRNNRDYRLYVSKAQAEDYAEQLYFEIRSIHKYCMMNENLSSDELYKNSVRINDLKEIMEQFDWNLDRHLIVNKMVEDLEQASSLGISYIDLITKKYNC